VTEIVQFDTDYIDYECKLLVTQLHYVCASRMRSLKVMYVVTSLTWLHLVAAAPDSPETNEAEHSHSAGGCDCMEYWTCVMR
jgi:hypothetical protein